MSSGLGKHQNAILSKLPDGKEVLLREVLWELALQYEKVETSGNYWGEVKEGTLNRSFVENTRRAFDVLVDSNIITRFERKLESISELIDKFEYVTSRLELFSLRRALKPYVDEFISLEQYSINRKIDFEEFQIKQIRETNHKLFADTKQHWLNIEAKLLYALSNETAKIDLLLSIICRGRFLFCARRKDSNAPLHHLLIQLNELENKSSTLKDIANCMTGLVGALSAMEDYRAGQIKDILYQFSDVGKMFSSSTSLHPDLKNFLFEKAPNIIKSLPGHKEPEGAKPSWLSRERIYSPLLDRLFDKYLFRKQIFVIKT